MTAFWEHIPRQVFGDIRRLMTLAWAVIGLCVTKKVSFNHRGEVVISNVQYAASHQRRFQRWLYKEHVNPATFYPLFAFPERNAVTSRSTTSMSLSGSPDRGDGLTSPCSSW